MERVNIYLDEDTKVAAQYIREHHALSTDSDAVRYAIREVARRVGWKPGDPPKPRRRRTQESPDA
jgi:Arc/MetJ family transcription regulator